MKREQKFEEIIRDKFEGFQAESPSWDSFEKVLEGNKSKTSRYRNGIIAAGLSVILIGVGLYYFSKDDQIGKHKELSQLTKTNKENKDAVLNEKVVDETGDLVIDSGVEIEDDVSDNEVLITNKILVENSKEGEVSSINIESIEEIDKEFIEELNEEIAKMPEIESVEADKIEDFNIAISDSRICLGEDIQIQADRINLNTDYVIDFGDGIKSESFSAMHSYTKSGEYIVKVIASNEGKEIIKEEKVQVIKAPKLDIGSFDLDKSEIVNKVSFDANSSVDNYTWYINNQLVSNKKSFDHTFDRQGKYVVKCVSTDNKCEMVAKKTIEVEGYYNIKQYMPTAFTPDNDGKNDFFEFSVLKNVVANDVSMKIFDRNGQMFFESNNLNEKWNGINQTDGKLAPSQNGYFWIIELTNEKGMKEVYKGTFVLVR